MSGSLVYINVKFCIKYIMKGREALKKFIPLQGKGSILALSLSITVAGVFSPSLSVGQILSPQSVYAAESQEKLLSKAEALALVKKLVDVPAGYKEEHSQLEKPSSYSELAVPAWNIYFRKDKEGGLHITVDARTGKLLRFSHFKDSNAKAHTGKTIGAKEAEQLAISFLHKVVDKQEAEKLSKANEYDQDGIDFITGFNHSFTFTRMEQNVPFLENGVQIIVDAEGNVRQFIRRWHEGSLPVATAKLSLAEAEKKLADSVKPSLAYVQLNEYIGDYGPGQRPYSLVYKYGVTDPLLVDANKGEVLDRFGKPVQAGDKIKPLGSTISEKRSSEKLITKEEAQKIADEIIKKFPGSYTSEGNAGSGMSSGPDGIIHREWHFRYVPTNAKEDQREGIRIEVSDTGEIRSFSNDESRFYEPGKKVENPISWDQAKENAIAVVKTLFADRLGELYLISDKPSAEVEKQQKAESVRGYSIRFGWLVNGVPVENASMHVEVNAETGKVQHLFTGSDMRNVTMLAESKPKIDVEAARQKDAEKKKVMLTYFQPSMDWRNYRWGVPEKSDPLLVYRYVGDESVVDAVTGEWISFRELRNRQQPQDIENHPSKAALLFAVEQGILKATNGQLEPDKAVTRGEMISMVVAIAGRFPIQDRMYRHFDEDDESLKPYQFDDVDTKSPYFAAIQQAIRMNIIPKKGNSFQPNAQVSRIEFAQILVRLAGYEKLLSKPEIFKTSYSDVEKKDVAVAALAEALELIGGEGKQMKPNSSVTRAEAAEALHKLTKQFSE